MNDFTRADTDTRNATISLIPRPSDLLPQGWDFHVKAIFAIFYLIISVMSLTGNSVVIVVIVYNKSMRTVTNTFLISLSISDMLIGAWTMPIELHSYFTNEWTLGETMCKLTRSIQGVTIVATIITLTGIAVDRYYAICHPLKARHIHTVRRAVVILTGFWIASFVLMVPQLLIQRLSSRLSLDLEADPQLRMVVACVERFSSRNHEIAYTLIVYLGLFILPFFIMILAYCKVAHYLWVRQPVGSLQSNPRYLARHLRQKKRVVKMLILLMLLFLTCWLPFFSTHVYVTFSNESQHTDILIASFKLLGYCNSCINPIVYAFLNEDFQNYIYDFFCSRCQRRNNAGTQNSLTVESMF